MEPIILPFKGVSPKIADTAFIAPGAVIVGDVEIGEDASVWYGAVLRGDVNHIRVGARTNIQDGTVIHVTHGGNPTLLGDDVLIGHSVTLHACTVESTGFVGMGATVLDGAVVKGGAMIAANALVTPGKVAGPGELWAGSPAKHVRAVKEEEAKWNAWAIPHYVRLGREHAAEVAKARG